MSGPATTRVPLLPWVPEDMLDDDGSQYTYMVKFGVGNKGVCPSNGGMLVMQHCGLLYFPNRHCAAYPLMFLLSSRELYLVLSASMSHSKLKSLVSRAHKSQCMSLSIPDYASRGRDESEGQGGVSRSSTACLLSQATDIVC